ncbi:MAG: hypothetical protein ACHQF3_02830 [Alphaproteobacteria bacterium]
MGPTTAVKYGPPIPEKAAGTNSREILRAIILTTRTAIEGFD